MEWFYLLHESKCFPGNWVDWILAIRWQVEAIDLSHVQLTFESKFHNMYSGLLFTHSCLRWLVLIILIYSIYRFIIGFIKHRAFNKTDNLFSQLTDKIIQLQLVIGIVLYIVSPLLSGFWKQEEKFSEYTDQQFFGIIHAIMMFIAVSLISAGVALAKRELNDKMKYKKLVIFFGLAFVIILISIPWPFSPLSNRPYIRTF